MKKRKEKNKNSVIILASLATFLLISFGIIAILSYNEKIEKTIEEKRQKKATYSSIVEKKDDIEDRLEYSQNKREAFNQKLLSGDTPAVAAAELQTILNDMASEFEFMIESQRIITPKERGIFLEVPVQITTQCTITKLKELLYQIETYPKFLSISNLDIRVVRVREPKDVKVTIDVSGFIFKAA